MTRVAALLLFSLGMAAAALFADEVVGNVGGRPVFVDTDPMGARIVVDGTLVPETTPALLRGLTPGVHRVQLALDGYQGADQSVDVGPDRVAQVSAHLVPDSVILTFPVDPTVTTPQGPVTTTGQQVVVPQATYSFQRLGTNLTVTPVFPDETLAALSGWGFLALAGAATVSTALDAFAPRQGSDGPSPVTVGLWVTTLLDVPWVLSVQGRKARFYRETAPRLVADTVQATQAQALFDDVERALDAGDLDAAAQFAGQLVERAPRSRLVPEAWFRLARIHSATGHRELALAEYRLVAETYPQADTYDRARKALADLYEPTSPAKAREQLDLMVLADDSITAADIDAQKQRLTTQEAPIGP
jgi:hypothetical protein